MFALCSVQVGERSEGRCRRVVFSCNSSPHLPTRCYTGSDCKTVYFANQPRSDKKSQRQYPFTQQQSQRIFFLRTVSFAPKTRRYQTARGIATLRECRR